MKNNYYVLERASRDDDYTVTVGKINDIADDVHELTSTENSEFIRWKKYDDIEAVLGYVYKLADHDLDTYDWMCKKQTFIAAKDLDDGDYEYLLKQGFGCIESRNEFLKTMEKGPYDPFVARVINIPERNNETYAIIDVCKFACKNLEQHSPVFNSKGECYSRSFATKQEAMDWVKSVPAVGKIRDDIADYEAIDDVPSPVDESNIEDDNDNNKEFEED